MHTSKLFELTDRRKIGFIEYGAPDGTPIFYFHGFPAQEINHQITQAVSA